MPGPDFALLTREFLNGGEASEEPDATERKTLDATLQLVAEYGERRVTMDDIAAGAQVARATVFRRFGSKDAVIARTYQREVRIARERTLAATDGASDAAEAIATGFSELMGFVLTHPVTRRLARAEPDIMVSLWRDGDAPGIGLIRAVVLRLADRGERPGTFAPQQLNVLADILARLLLGVLLVPDAGSSWAADRSDREAVIARLVASVAGD